jgi:hemerythrin-like metal-binding protein
MARIIWDKSLDTGIALIDKQHQKLAILFNQINQIMEDGASLTALKSSIQEISLYAEYHFKTEEDLMLQAGFPGLTVHQEQHSFFKKKAGEILQRLENQQEASNISVQASSLLWEWFLGHVKETDREYIEPIKMIVTAQTAEKNASIELLAEHEEKIMHLY